MFVLCIHSTTAREPGDYTSARLTMVNQLLIREGITDKNVIRAMRRVPRHLFVRPEDRRLAYFDMALPIGHKQTISGPFVVAYMTQFIDPQPTDRVLEIGTGSGYQAAVLAQVVKHVYSIEIVEPLAALSAERFKSLRYRNVTSKVGDGYKGWAAHAPFDKIIVTCSPENVPQPLIDQLREGGKMVIPLGERYQQVLYLFKKHNGKLKKTTLVPTLFVPMTGISEDRRKVQPDPLRPHVLNGSFEKDEDKNSSPDGWYYCRQLTLGKQQAPDGKVHALFTNRHPGRSAQAIQGMAIDGSKVTSLKVSLRVMAQRARSGTKANEKPALIITFYDSERNSIAKRGIGPWLGSFQWRHVSEIIKVPEEAREAILLIGLNGATGKLGVDDVRLSPE